MPEWLIERGIGEIRTALVEDGRIIEARILRDDVVPAGTVLEARLSSVGRNAVAVADGQEYLLPRAARGVTEGARLNIEVAREAWRQRAMETAVGAGNRRVARPSHLPQGRILQFPGPADELEAFGWSELLDDARSGLIGFPGGELRVSLTPAMTLIDVDGQLPPAELAMAGAKAAAETIRRQGVSGSIGIDLPTVGSKEVRQAAAAAVDAVLPPPFERTAVNGFGFVQIVRPRTTPRCSNSRAIARPSRPAPCSAGRPEKSGQFAWRPIQR